MGCTVSTNEVIHAGCKVLEVPSRVWLYCLVAIPPFMWSCSSKAKKFVVVAH
jgi:hypothetical protein